jgi:predicted acylesterase/phospholipase RssA
MSRGILAGPCVAFALVVATAALCGCAVNRPELSKPELERRAEMTRAQMVDDHRVVTRKLVNRMRNEQAEHEARLARGEPSEPPTFDVLILSGGGDHGAFGAGVLRGWGQATGPLSRPKFDVVTGVSTGALIAPFAFIGDDAAYDQIVRLYREPKKDWVALRGLLFFLPWQESFADTKGLRRDLERELPRRVIQRMADESREGRVLQIGTTNLDMGVTRGFALGEESEQAAYTGEYKRIYDILMASAAIPGAFPPVVIDDELYVDGGTTSNILFGSNLRSREAVIGAWKETHPGRPTSRIRFWVIINNQLGVAPTQVQPKWPSIVGHSLSTSIRFSTIASLRNLAAQAELIRAVDGFPAEFRYIAIPDSWRAPVDGVFMKETMESLADLGEQLGADPTNWREELPDR